MGEKKKANSAPVSIMSLRALLPKSSMDRAFSVSIAIPKQATIVSITVKGSSDGKPRTMIMPVVADGKQSDVGNGVEIDDGVLLAQVVVEVAQDGSPRLSSQQLRWEDDGISRGDGRTTPPNSEKKATS